MASRRTTTQPDALPSSWQNAAPREPLPGMLRAPGRKRPRQGAAAGNTAPSAAPGTSNAAESAPRPAVFPAGIAMIATVQFLIAGLLVVMSLLMGAGRLEAGGQALRVITMGWPALLLLCGAVGLVCRAGWGWRVTAAIFWFLTGNPVFDLVVSLVEGRPFPLAVNAGVLVVAVGALVYLNGARRMAVFGFRDAPAIARARPLPMVAGVSAAAVRCLATVLG